MKVLWLSNVELSESPIKTSGGWVSDMWRTIRTLDDIKIYNFALTNSRKENITTFQNTSQWTFCRSRMNRIYKNGTKENKSIISLINDISPDVIHIWGVETAWTNLYLNSLHSAYQRRTLLEIQGLMFISAEFYFNGLGLMPITKITGILDFIFPKMSAIYNYFHFQRFGKFEKQIISKALNINTQSEYVRDAISLYISGANVFHTGIILREQFLNLSRIDSNEGIKNICTVTSRATYKGLHITLKAFSIVHAIYPYIRLKIIGVNVFKYANFGYVSYLKRLAKVLKIDESIDWMGYLDASQILDIYKDSSCYINSSFTETYCLSLAEALTVGMPCVVSESGAMLELVTNNETALTFPMTDFNSAGTKLLQIIESDGLRNNLSINAYNSMKKRNNPSEIAKRQIDTYFHILSSI